MYGRNFVESISSISWCVVSPNLFLSSFLNISTQLMSNPRFGSKLNFVIRELMEVSSPFRLNIIPSRYSEL